MWITGGFDACQCNSLLEAIYFGRNDFDENSLFISYKVSCIRYWFQSKIWQCWLIFREKSVFFSSQSPKTNQLDFIYYKLRFVPKPSSQNDSQSRFQRNEIPCGENTVYIKNFIKIWRRYIYRYISPALFLFQMLTTIHIYNFAGHVILQWKWRNYNNLPWPTISLREHVFKTIFQVNQLLRDIFSEDTARWVWSIFMTRQPSRCVFKRYMS